MGSSDRDSRLIDYTASPSISIVIPTRNAGPGFRETLRAIRQQSLDSELVIVDSGSKDGTLETAKEFGARVVSIPPEKFNHGETRNLGIRNSSGEICVMLVQDAIPSGQAWLRDLVSPFSNERVVGVTARQQPRPDCDPVGRWQVDYHNQFLGESVQIREWRGWEHFQSLSFEERLRLVSFDNVCSALRRDFWEDHPFKALPFAEDLDWGMRAIVAGRQLVFNPSVTVIHSHARPAAYHMKRSYVYGRVVPKILRLTPPDVGMRTDAAFLGQIGFVFGEAEAMIAGRVTDWREFRRSCGLNQSLWKSLLAAIRPRRNVRPDQIRNTFYFLVEQLAANTSDFATRPGLDYVLVHALAQTVGSFAASYYNWCERQGTISDDMKRLDQALSAGV
jgi:glycosyltransferase involved in cell wall biosynthesis